MIDINNLRHFSKGDKIYLFLRYVLLGKIIGASSKKMKRLQPSLHQDICIFQTEGFNLKKKSEHYSSIFKQDQIFSKYASRIRNNSMIDM